MTKISLTSSEASRIFKQIIWADVDPEIEDIVLKINLIPGMCTLQSCEGHKRGKYIDDAQLWIWMTDDCMRVFEETVQILAGNSNIHRLYKQYLPVKNKGYMEIIDIRFAGLGKEERKFIEAKKSILSHLKMVSNIVFA